MKNLLLIYAGLLFCLVSSLPALAQSSTDLFADFTEQASVSNDGHTDYYGTSVNASPPVIAGVGTEFNAHAEPGDPEIPNVLHVPKPIDDNWNGAGGGAALKEDGDNGNSDKAIDGLTEDCAYVLDPTSCTETGDDLENVALMGIPTSFDNQNDPRNGGPQVLTDGNRNGNYQIGEIWSANRAGSYADIDLLTAQHIKELRVYGRTDCCNFRMNGIYIMISDQPFPAANDVAASQAVATYEFQNPENYNSFAPIIIFPETMGRYLRVIAPGTVLLNLAEIEARTCPQDATALPIDLTYFRGKAQQKTNFLEWQTSTEENNSGFWLQRAQGATPHDFTDIAWIEGNNLASHYHYTDTGITPGNVFYRLRQVDYDGTASLSPIVHLDRATNLDWSAYPNPVGPERNITIEWNNAQEVAPTFELFSVTGKLLRQQRTALRSGGGKVKLSVRDLPAGVYLLRNTLGEGVLRVVLTGE